MESLPFLLICFERKSDVVDDDYDDICVQHEYGRFPGGKLDNEK